MVFLGCLFDREKESVYLQKSRSGLSNAANGYQWNLVDGLNANLQKPITVVNALPVGIWKRQYADFRLESNTWHYRGADCYEIGCINLPFIKQHQRYRKCKKLLKTLKDKQIILYSAYAPFMKAVSKLDSSYNVTLIVTDLPEYYDLGKVGALKRFLRKRNNKKIYRYMKRVNRFVLLTEQMKEPLSVGDRPYVIVEGICPQLDESLLNAAETKEKAILYTGTLHEKYGIGNLMEAFSGIKDPNYRLWICGGGDTRAKIEVAADKDARITFFGYVPKTKIKELQQQATVLVNPRQNNDAFTKYSFPSKTMEYMLSGKPVVMYKLDGIPDEYDSFLHYVPNNSVEALRETLVRICEQSKEERTAFAKRAQAFVATQKNGREQAKKILRMMNKREWKSQEAENVCITDLK